MTSGSRSQRVSTVAVCLGLVVLLPSFGHSQVVVKAGEQATFRFGMLFQEWAEWNQEPSGDYAQNLFTRRIRVMVGGQLTPALGFFFQLDHPNLGKATVNGKNVASGLIVQDAILQWKVADALTLEAGWMFIPLSRNHLQSGAAHLTLDYGTYTFLESGPTQSAAGRDTGFQARGYAAKNRLEYRLGAFQGARMQGARNPFRLTGRAQYNFLSPEVGFFYPGVYLGEKKVLALGAAFDRQQAYHAFAADGFLDHPLGRGAVTAQANYMRWDGGDTFTTLPAQDNVHLEAGYYVQSLRLLPFGRFEGQYFRDDLLKTRNEERLQAGLTYYWSGANLNVRAAYSRVLRRQGRDTNTWTIQLQGFYY